MPSTPQDGRTRSLLVTQEFAEEDLLLLQDVLEEVVNGRPDGHPCPFCSGGPLEAELDGANVSVACPDCGKTFKGRLR